MPILRPSLLSLGFLRPPMVCLRPPSLKTLMYTGFFASAQMKEIKVRFDEVDLAALDQQAEAAGISRAELIRTRALVANCDSKLTVASYHRLVSDALANVRGDIPRRMVEQLVAYVITWISSKSQTNSNQSSTDCMTA